MVRSMSLAVLLGAAACSSDGPISEEQAIEYAEARCGAPVECCESADEPFRTCVNERVQKMMRYEDIVRSDLTFSQSCMEEVLDWASEGIPCSSAERLEAPDCRLAHGARRLDAACTVLDDLGYFASDCGADLWCVDGRCVDSLPTPPARVVGVGGACDDTHLCVLGAECGSDHTCARVTSTAAVCD